MTELESSRLFLTEDEAKDMRLFQEQYALSSLLCYGWLGVNWCSETLALAMTHRDSPTCGSATYSRFTLLHETTELLSSALLMMADDRHDEV